MTTFTLTGQDSLTLNDRVFTDLADGDAAVFTYPNDITATKTGKNKNTIHALNETGSNVDGIIRIISGSSDDRFLQGLLTQMERDISAFSQIKGQGVKRLGDGEGSVTRDVLTLEGGVFSRKIDRKTNVEGDTEQAVSVYNLRFANGKRTLE